MEQRSERDQWLLESLARQVAVMEGLVAAALDAAAGDDEEEAARRWWAVERQAGRFLRMLHAGSGRGRARCKPEHAAHAANLERSQEQAREALARFDPAVVADAAASAGLRVAVIGKGGAGKSTISATLARLLARRGRAVLAADLDTNPGMAYSLGVPPATGGLARDAVEPHPGAPYGWSLRSGLVPAEAVERFAVPGPDGVHFLSVGKIEGVEKLGPKRTVAAMRELLNGLGDPLWDVVGDLEAGPTTPFEGYHRFGDLRADGRTAVADLEAGLNDLLWAAPGPDDVVLVVTEPGAASMEVARRAGTIATELGIRRLVGVSNRSTGETDVARLAEVLPGREIVAVPEDPAVERAAHLGQAPFDRDAGSPAMAAIARLADRLAGGG